MPQTAAPFGLKIVKAQGGPITQSTERLVLSVNSAGALILPNSGSTATTVNVGNIFAGDPIYYDGGGAIQQTTAGAGGVVLGTFQGVEYSDSSGKRTVSNKWTGPGLFPGSEVWFWHTSASTADWIFEIQTSAPITQDFIGQTFGVTYAGFTPNTVTGFSVAALNPGVTGGPLQLYGLAYDINLSTSVGYATGTPTAGNNNWGDPVVNVYVKLAKGQFTAPTTAF